MLTEILDTNRNTFGHYDRLIAAGVKTVIRYLAAGLEHEEKVIKHGEAHAIADAGLRLGLVYETNGHPNGAATGHRDGEAARAQAIAVGAPADGSVIIWYTVDYDAGGGDVPGIRAAFQNFRAALNADASGAVHFRVGCYASGFICDELKKDGLSDASWLTDSKGFRGTRDAIAKGDYDMMQALPVNIAGLDTDPDARHVGADGKAADIGDFVPFAVPAALPGAVA